MIFTNTFVEILIAAAILLISYFKWSFQYWKGMNIPYLEPSFPFGNFKPPHKRTVPLGLELEEMYKIAKSKGWKYCGIYVMENPFYLVCDVEICKLLLTRDFNHFSDRGLYYNEKSDPISAHLFVLGGTQWRNARAKLTPTFTTAKIRSMFSTLSACRVPLEKFFEEEVAKGRPIDMKLTTDKFAVDVIGSCAFGIQCNSFDDPDSTFVQYGRKSFDNHFLRVVRDFIGLSYENFAKFIGLKVFDSDVSDFFSKTVEDAINYRRANNIIRADFLQALIELMYNEKEYRNLETLRLYPPVTFITRECVQDWKIPDTDTYIEKGTKIFVPITGFHYDSEYFKVPKKFNPERFENKDSIPSHAYIPFGEGPRTCIGMRFGLTEVKVGLTSILRKYRVRVNKGTKEPLVFNKDGMILQAIDPILLDFEKLK